MKRGHGSLRNAPRPRAATESAAVTRRVIIAYAPLVTCFAALLPTPPSIAQQYTSWGWPPSTDEKISAASVAWLESKGWWPMGVAWQAPSSGQNATHAVMAQLDLLGQRGIESKFRSFDAGPAVNEAVKSGRMQVGAVGNLPFAALLADDVPVKAIKVSVPNLKCSTVVRLDSPLRNLADLKGASKPQPIGVAMGTSAEFYLQQAAWANGLAVDKDIVLRNKQVADEVLLPSGLAAVVLWEPWVSLVTEVRKTGREIDTVFPYNLTASFLFVRQELIDNVPDVVQAISDAHQEAQLWIRLNPEQAAETLATEPRLRGLDKELLLRQIQLYNNLYKPTCNYPFAAFWGEENARVASWLLEAKRISRPITAGDFAAAVDTRFIDKTYEKLGWRIPDRPPFLPADWKGKIGAPPYPPYLTVDTLTGPQAWPEPGDLVRPWTFNGTTYQP